MTSKYEDIKSVVEDYIKVYEADLLEFYNDDHDEGDKVDAVFKYIRQALRKAEAMDRLIEARKGTSNGEWHRVGQPWNNASPYIISGHHDPHVGKAIIDVVDQDEFTGEDDADLERQEQEHKAEQIINCDFICLAANETAKFIESNHKK